VEEDGNLSPTRSAYDTSLHYVNMPNKQAIIYTFSTTTVATGWLLSQCLIYFI